MPEAPVEILQCAADTPSPLGELGSTTPEMQRGSYQFHILAGKGKAGFVGVIAHVVLGHGQAIAIRRILA